MGPVSMLKGEQGLIVAFLILVFCVFFEVLTFSYEVLQENMTPPPYFMRHRLLTDLTRLQIIKFFEITY